MHAQPARNLPHARTDVLLAVQNNMVRAPTRPRDRRLRRRARRPNHHRSPCLAHLREPQPQPARAGVHQDVVALAHGGGFGRERERGQAVHEARGAGAGGEWGREGRRCGSVGGGVLGEHRCSQAELRETVVLVSVLTSRSDGRDGGEGGKGGAHAGDLAPELEAALAEGLAGQEGDVCWERDDRACCLYAESGGEGEEGKAASALLDVEEVDAGVFDLML